MIRRIRTNGAIEDTCAHALVEGKRATDSHSQNAENLRIQANSGDLVDNLELVLVVLIGQKLGSFY
jgi:hypothetical protein